MSQPLDRNCEHEQLGELDREAGELWISNPFRLPSEGKNLSAFERNAFYLNLHGEGFLDSSFVSAADIESDSRSVAAGDFNGDGRPDLLVGSVGGGPLRLFLNQIPQGNRVQLDLQGTTSNRPAIGARVIARCGSQQFVRDLFPANGCMGSGPARLMLGVGDHDTIEELTVRWPSGTLETFKGVPARGRVRIVEGTSEFRHTEPPASTQAAASVSGPVSPE